MASLKTEFALSDAVELEMRMLQPRVLSKLLDAPLRNVSPNVPLVNVLRRHSGDRDAFARRLIQQSDPAVADLVRSLESLDKADRDAAVKAEQAKRIAMRRTEARQGGGWAKKTAVARIRPKAWPPIESMFWRPEVCWA